MMGRQRPSIERLEGFLIELQDEPDRITTVRTDKVVSVSPGIKKKTQQASSSNISLKKNNRKDSSVKARDEDEQREIEEQDDKMSMDDELQFQPSAIQLRRNRGRDEPIDILSQYSGKSNDPPSNHLSSKVGKAASQAPDSEHGSYRGSTNSQLPTKFVRAGQNVINHMSASNASASGRSSASSRNMPHKENYSGRFCGCPSRNTIEDPKDAYTGRKPPIEPEGQVHYDQLMGNPRKRVNTENDWMINSHGPIHEMAGGKSGARQTSEMSSEVEILQGNQLFKKKNKANRIGGGVGVVNSNIYNISEQEISERASRRGPVIGGLEEDISECTSRVGRAVGLEEDSLESMVVGNYSSQKSSMYEGVEVESVK